MNFTHSIIPGKNEGLFLVLVVGKSVFSRCISNFFVLSGPNISPVGFFPTCDKILWGWLKENKSSNIGN